MRAARHLSWLSAGALVLALSGCANYPVTAPTYPSSTTYPGATTSAPTYAQYGRVANVELVKTPSGNIGIGGTGVGAGTVLGGVLGGVLGHQVGGGTGRDVATIAGVVGGAMVGNAMDKNRQQPVGEVYRVTVQLDGGSTQVFDYASAPNVRVGDRVRVENNQLYR